MARSGTKRAGLLAVALLIAVVLEPCMSFAEPVSAEPECLTLVKGANHRASILQSFEGYLAQATFSGEDQHAGEFPHVRVDLHVDDRRHDRWYAEMRTWSVESSTDQYTLAVCDGDRYTMGGMADADDLYWGTKRDRAIGDLAAVESRVFGLVTVDAEMLEEVVHMDATQIDLPEGRLWRLHIVKNSPTRADDLYCWIDPSLGFALKQFVGVLRMAERTALVMQRFEDFSECAPGLWLPTHAVEIRGTHQPDEGLWSWEWLSEWQIILAEVNQPVGDLAAAMVAALDSTDRRRVVPTRLSDDDVVELQAPASGGHGLATEVGHWAEGRTVEELRDKLFEDVEQGPGDPVAVLREVVEPLLQQ